MRRSTTTRRAVALAAAVALVAGACSGDDGESATADGSGGGEEAAATTAPAVDDRAWPVPDWQPISATDAGLDQAALDAMATSAEAAASNCLVVTKDGELVDEWYWNGWDESTEQEVFSATKSISSTLVGIAADQGLLSLDDSASDYIPEWKGTPSEAVTIRNLVSNDSGRFQDFQSDYVTMTLQEPDKTGYAIGLSQQHEPGTQWVYNNAAIQTLDRVIQEATGMPTHEYATQELFEPLGMASSISTDEAGNTLTYMGAQASCRDLARFGLLFLREGEWDGEQVVSSAWVDEATHPSQDLNPNYGFLWWLFGDRAGAGGGATPRGGTVPPAPEGSGFYAALGLGNQIVAVFPESGVVVTRIGTQRGLGGAAAGPQFTVADVGVGVQRALGNEVSEDDLGLGDSGVATGG